MMVTSSQRFTRDHVCPICGGHSGLPQGRGIRCYGFSSKDGQWAHCTRSEYSGLLRQTDACTFAHRLNAYCDCGQHHSVPSMPLLNVNPVLDSDRVFAAQRIWEQSRPAEGTPVEIYLKSRGLICPIPTSLRFTTLRYMSSPNKYPVMIASVRRWPEAQPVAVHRTYLRWDGKGKAEVAQPKLSYGPIRVGAIQLYSPGEILLICEGVETALSGQQETDIPAWAAISASNLPYVVLPALPLAREIVIAADGDEAGVKAARRAASIWAGQGRNVRIAVPPAGTDLNDLLRGC